MATLSAMPKRAILITGFILPFLALFLPKSLLAMKYSKFTLYHFSEKIRKITSGLKVAYLLKAAIFLLLPIVACSQPIHQDAIPKKIIVGAERIDLYLELLDDKEVALVGNHTSLIGSEHWVDTMLTLGLNITKVFVPEHGFRGVADAGESIENARDRKTKIPLISLYGKNKKPKNADFIDVEVVVFDLQDVGVRYYTYISTLYYVMQSCAENKVPLIVLDRPNPNGFYVDGPMLDYRFRSFVGMLPIPLVHGLTVGELAQMINGEGWLEGGLNCDLTVIQCKNYDHSKRYELPVNPSPNLKTTESIYLYPSLGFFEGTIVSVGRGTDQPFTIIGHPQYSKGAYSFTPVSREGARYPPLENQLCKGINLKESFTSSEIANHGLQIKWVIDFYKNLGSKEDFFLRNNFFDMLAGSDVLRKDILAGKSESEIRKSWEAGLNEFLPKRKKYLLYPDFDEN